MSKFIHPNPGACCVYLWVRWIGKGLQLVCQRKKWGCSPIQPIWCTSSSLYTYSIWLRIHCLYQLKLAAVCIHQLLNTSFDQDGGSTEEAWQWFSMHPVTSSQGCQVVAVRHGSPTLAHHPPSFPSLLHPSVLLLPDSFYRSADFTNRPHWLNLILLDRAALLSVFSLMDSSVCEYVRVCCSHACANARNNKAKLPSSTRSIIQLFLSREFQTHSPSNGSVWVNVLLWVVHADWGVS